MCTYVSTPARLRTCAALLQVCMRERAGGHTNRICTALHRRLQVHGRVTCAHALRFRHADRTVGDTLCQHMLLPGDLAR